MAANNIKMRSSISDEDLAKMIEEDKRRNPSDFSVGPVVCVDSITPRKYSKISNPTTTFDVIRKWL